MMTRQARPSAKINGFDTHMILEAVPAQPSKHPNGHQVINRTSRHYAGALYGRLHVIAYRATLDVPRQLAQFVARQLRAERRRRGTPHGGRALSCFWQAVLGLRWFRDRITAEALARDHGISRATAYRYLDEVIKVLADEAPGLGEALERARDEGFSHVILDGTVIACDRCKEPALSVKGEVIDLWYSGKAQRR